MPKIFLIKNRLHQQQLRLQESQSLIQNKSEDRLNIEPPTEPLSLVSRKRNNEDNNLNRNEQGKKHRILLFT